CSTWSWLFAGGLSESGAPRTVRRTSTHQPAASCSLKLEFCRDLIEGARADLTPADRLGFGAKGVGVLDLGQVLSDGLAHVKCSGPPRGRSEGVEPGLNVLREPDT